MRERRGKYSPLVHYKRPGRTTENTKKGGEEFNVDDLLLVYQSPMQANMMAKYPHLLMVGLGGVRVTVPALAHTCSHLHSPSATGARPAWTYPMPRPSPCPGTRIRRRIHWLADRIIGVVFAP